MFMFGVCLLSLPDSTIMIGRCRGVLAYSMTRRKMLGRHSTFDLQDILVNVHFAPYVLAFMINYTHAR